MLKRHPLLIILAIYFAASLTTLWSWDHYKSHPMTGDEPHYLVMAQGFLTSGSLEQSQPYAYEFNNRKIVKEGLAPKDTVPSIYNSHTFLGAHGLYNYHNLGFPLILAIPFLIAGVAGAKLILILLGALAVMLTWKVSGVYTADKMVRFFTTLVSSVSSVVILGANQIYPDLLAGIFCLLGIYWFLTIHRRPGILHNALFTLVISLLPWLQIKFAAASIFIMIAVGLKLITDAKNYKTLMVMAVIFATSGFLLLAYNHYAFGNALGPYTAGNVEFSLTSLMTFFGLHLDQNQGLLLQSPVALVGIAFLGLFFASDWKTALLVTLVYLSLMVPSALHTNWYGGVSFSGRFTWTAAMVFIIPVVFGLIELSRLNIKGFRVVIAIALVLQAYFFFQYTFANVDILRRDPSTPLEVYSVFFAPVHAWLPAFYNVQWAFQFPPNYAWMLLTVLLLIAGFSTIEKLKLRLISALVVGGVAVLISGFMVNDSVTENIFAAKDLPGLTGQIQNDLRVVTSGVDKAGYASFGPYILLDSGSYSLNVTTRSDASTDQVVGRLEVSDSTTGKLLEQQPLHGTAGITGKTEIRFEVHTWNPHRYEFRNYWDGAAGMELHGMELKKIGDK